MDIQIDPRPIASDEFGKSAAHCVMGKIRYPRPDASDDAERWSPPGYLLYIKASLTGDEPADLLAFKAKHAHFPHESTGDQWYSESQFESYRALGEHIITEVMEVARSDEITERARGGTRMDETVSAALREAKAVMNAGQAPESPTYEELYEICDRETLFARLSER